jgi:hypothetical protein
MRGSTEISSKGKNIAIGCGVAASGALVVGGAVAAGIAFKKHKAKNFNSKDSTSTQNPQTHQTAKIGPNIQNKPRCESERVFHGAEFRRMIDVLKVLISQLKTRDGEEKAYPFCDICVAICTLAKGMIQIEMDLETLPALKSFALRYIWFEYEQIAKKRFEKALITFYRDPRPVQNVLNLINKAHQTVEVRFHQLRNKLTLEQNWMLTAIDYNFGFAI